MVAGVTDASFQQLVLQANGPVLVDFWAQWCGPCKAMAPALDQLAEQYRGQVKIVKLEVEENQKTAADFAVRGVPSLLFFDAGEVKAMLSGARPASEIATFIEGQM